MANRGADERISEDVLNEISRQVVDNILANDLIMIKDDVKNSLDVNRSSGLPKKIGLSSYETDETCLGKAVDSIDDKHLRLERTKFPMNDMNWNSKDAESTARNVSRTAGCRYENRTIVASVDKDGRNIIIGINDSQNLANEFAIPGILDGSKINDLSDGRSQASGGKQSYEADVKAYDDGDLVDIVDVVAERCEKVFTTMLTDDEEEKKMKAAPTRTKEFKPEIPSSAKETLDLSNMRDSHDDDDDKHRCLKSSSEEDASETIVSAAQSVTENVNEIFDAAKGSMRTFSDEMDVKDEHITGKLGFGAADEKNRSTESMEERDTSALSRITEKAAEIKENVTNAAGAITSDVEDGKETIKSDIMGISKSISAAVEPDRVKGGIEERVKDVTEGIASLKIMNGDEMIQISEETPDIEEPSSDAKYEITGVFDKTSHVFTSSIEKASEVLASSIEKASEVIMPIVEKASEVVQPFAEKSSEIMQPLADKSCEFLKPIVDKSSAVLQPIVDKSSEILQPFAEKSSEVFTPMFEKSTEILKTLDEKSSTYEREIVPHEGVFGTTSPKQGPSDRSSDHKDESVARTHDVGQGSRDKKSDTLKSKSSASNNPGPRWKRCTIL